MNYITLGIAVVLGALAFAMGVFACEDVPLRQFLPSFLLLVPAVALFILSFTS